MTDLTLKALRAVSLARSNRWHPGGIEDWSVSDWAVAMAGEAGEVCNAVKKLNRILTDAASRNEVGRHFETEAEAVAAIGAEIADTLLYLDLLAARLGIDLEAAVVEKFNAVSRNYGFPERLGAGAAAPATGLDAESCAPLLAIAAERLRQVEAEGWTAEHDDEHDDGSMAQAAACYALPTPQVSNRTEYAHTARGECAVPSSFDDIPTLWPHTWHSKWWKPKDRRRNLVVAGALIVAEIERLDRAAERAGADGSPDEAA